MKFVSTRGGATVTFKEAVLEGLSTDGGLYVPVTIPAVTPETLKAWSALPFPRLSEEILSLFTGDVLPRAQLGPMCDASYSTFRVKDVVALEPAGPVQVLELFHGPTFAFKDVALQLVGNLFAHFRAEDQDARPAPLTVLGATSGDTGSAALAGVRGKKGIEAFILFPKGRVSEVQQRQMTSMLDDNIHCIAVEGTFDDCQDAVKALFKDKAFKEKHRLAAVNSINWARIAAQIVYYFKAYYLAIAKIPGAVLGQTKVFLFFIFYLRNNKVNDFFILFYF